MVELGLLRRRKTKTEPLMHTTAHTHRFCVTALEHDMLEVLGLVRPVINSSTPTIRVPILQVY